MARVIPIEREHTIKVLDGYDRHKYDHHIMSLVDIFGKVDITEKKGKRKN